MKFTATFPLAGRAKDFAVRIQEPGWHATAIVKTGRVVTFEVPTPEHNPPITSEHTTFLDYLEAVGYYGSDQSRKATLTVEFADGNTLTRHAPMAY